MEAERANGNNGDSALIKFCKPTISERNLMQTKWSLRLSTTNFRQFSLKFHCYTSVVEDDLGRQ